ncbi:lactate utilization protein C [Methylocella sp.]|uniref:lactate utilization protein C n=1 Tax=Methylocella sp. TaxID=1978226 RepID=UPI003782E8AC
MSAREKIFATLRRDLGGPRPPAKVEAEARLLAAEAALSRPQLSSPDLVEAFCARLLSPKVVGASVERVARLEDVPAAVLAYCAAQGLAPAIALQPDAALAALGWSGVTLHASAARDEAVAVGRARWAIAETGTFVFHSGADTPVLLAFLPLHHICVIEAERILGHLEDYAAAEAGKPAPRNVNFITGASGTSDIEGRLVRGAHGPAFLHGIIVDPRGAAR